MYTDTIMDNIKYLNMLAKEFPSAQRASAEIISLEAKLKLPKSTEESRSYIYSNSKA